MKKLNVLIVAILAIVVVVGASAQSTKTKAMKETTKEISITGEVIDQKCYTTGMMGGKGEEHKQCAIDCIKGGLPVGLLEDKTEKVYTLVPKSPGMKGANDELVQYAAQKVKLTGTVAKKGGLALFIYSKVEAAK